ncbi:MAG: rhodanese-like domain-containing protein [Cytophagales bacterium]|nr:rhodanese-like domain-containing protein [Bernardetiaceae bacterium]MDW8210216.1 rhodanese-like domain-containing protein [Cytophagales bacterium]
MQVIRLTPEQFKEMQAQDPGVLIDVRTPSEYQAGHIAGASNVDFLAGQFAAEFPQYDKSKTYYLYCASGNRSGKAAQLMLEAGFPKAYNVGGFAELAGAGFPVEY